MDREAGPIFECFDRVWPESVNRSFSAHVAVTTHAVNSIWLLSPTLRQDSRLSTLRYDPLRAYTSKSGQNAQKLTIVV